MCLVTDHGGKKSFPLPLGFLTSCKLEEVIGKINGVSIELEKKEDGSN